MIVRILYTFFKKSHFYLHFLDVKLDTNLGQDLKLLLHQLSQAQPIITLIYQPGYLEGHARYVEES